MTAFIKGQRDAFGVDPICRVLQIAPAAYYARAAITRNPDLASDRAKRDLVDAKEIGRVFKASRVATGPARFGINCAESSMISRGVPLKGSCRCLVYKALREERSGRQFLIQRSPVLMIKLTASSRRRRQISFGYLTLLTFPAGLAWSMWPLSLMCLPAKSWASVYQLR